MKLHGIKVLDLSQFLPGPHLTMTMADHGADVIMVEPANGTGEPVRAMGTRDAQGTAVWFRNIARGKAKGWGPDIGWFTDPSGNILSVLEN